MTSKQSPVIDEVNIKPFNKKEVRRDLILLAFPIMLQNLVQSFLNMVDTLMIGKLGSVEIAAVGLANNLYFLFILLMFGINSGASIFTAQFHGKDDHKNMRRSIGLSMILGLMFASVFMMIGLFGSELFMSSFIEDANVVGIGASYLRITSFSYAFTAISFSLSFAYRSIGKAKIPLVFSSIGLVTNTVFNYLWIFGAFGMPAWGVDGAAYATVLARIVEFALIFTYIKNDELIHVKWADLKAIDKDFVKTVLKTATPVIGNEFIWSLGIVMYSAAVAKLGKDAVASMQIGQAVINFYSVVFFGIGNACAIVLGKEIGAKRFDEAYKAAIEIMKVSVVAALFVSILTISTSSFAVGFFNVSKEVADNALWILYISAAFTLFRIFTINLVVGILRSGGDTWFSFIMEMGSIWLYGVPIAFLGALVFHWSLPVLYIAICLEEVIKACIGIPRFLSRKWLNNLVEHVD